MGCSSSANAPSSDDFGSSSSPVAVKLQPRSPTTPSKPSETPPPAFIAAALSDNVASMNTAIDAVEGGWSFAKTAKHPTSGLTVFHAAVSAGSTAAVTSLLERDPSLLSTTTSMKDTPLHLAGRLSHSNA